MGINLSQLSDKQRALIAPKDRAILGKAAETFTDALMRGEARSERQLQSQIVNLLRLKGIEVLWHRTDKKSHATIGWPDLTFAYRNEACAWEVKLPGKLLDEQQERMAELLKASPNVWRYRVIRSVDQAREELTKLGMK